MAKAKRVTGINCKSVASIGIKLVLVTRFEELYGFQETALDWSDPEGVHSMRVASRRLRSALRDFQPYLRKRGLTSVQKRLRNLAGSLGEVRDHDVAILALEELEKKAPATVSPTLKQFIETRKERREQAREDLKSALDKTQLDQLQSDFVAAVDGATDGAKMVSKLQITYLQMSRAVIADRLKELEKLSADVYKPFEVETLHDMRIAAKRLRYAVELFQSCWGRSIGLYAKRAARLQTALGDLHDCDVWIESFGEAIDAARKQKQEAQVAAFVWLLGHFVKLRTKHLRRAFAEWTKWEAQDLSGKLRESLRNKSS
ncbi:MAG TPA: CHAD domain-containing protein [Pyrinomonadaceae bacterium]|nr:CHAD domain-containing protein [Pyrinomonadaceae bacterium]